MYVALYTFCVSVEFGILFQFGVTSYLKGRTTDQIEHHLCGTEHGDKSLQYQIE